MASDNSISRDDLAAVYLESLPFDPYPVQEEALLAWFTSDQGVLVCAPTGTGKTLIAEAAIFEALKTGKRAYYTTPLIALTEQKLTEIRQSAQRWGFSPDDIGLVTGNRRINADAPVLVVVAEILFNRLLHSADDFDQVSAVVMDEFHSFNDPERGIVWEFSLGMLPAHVRLLLLSATVGNSMEFKMWLDRSHGREIDLVQSEDRKVPLSFQWVGDELLNDHVEKIARGDDETRRTPALIFCFNRDQCWEVAEQLKGKKLISDAQKTGLSAELANHDFSQGAGPKLKQILMRGVGVHHAGVLPSYKRIVEDLYQRKLLAVTVCTETLAAGINLPARSVVVPNLLKGPPGKKKLIEPSAAHQMFGRAGRPQFDTEGFVFGLAHEDDVRILRAKEKYDQIPEDTKDPKLLKAKKALKKKIPKRRQNEQYWDETHFEKLRVAPSANLQSVGAIPWRLLSYMLMATPEVDPIRRLISKRLMTTKQVEVAQRELDRKLMALWTAGYVTLEPRPPLRDEEEQVEEPKPAPSKLLQAILGDDQPVVEEKPRYRPVTAIPEQSLEKLLMLRGVNPLFGIFVINQLGIADRNERIQAMEGMLEMPGSVARYVRVPSHDELAPGPLATTRLDERLLQLGLATAEEISAPEQPEEDHREMFPEDRVYVIHLADKLHRLFGHDFPGVQDYRVSPVWAAGEILEFGGDFNKYITSKRLQKQEGVLFRHLLRLILLIGEFSRICPPDTTESEWQTDLLEIRDSLVQTCHVVDPTSTDRTLAESESIEQSVT